MYDGSDAGGGIRRVGGKLVRVSTGRGMLVRVSRMVGASKVKRRERERKRERKGERGEGGKG